VNGDYNAMRPRPVILLATLLALVLAACGGSAESTATAPATSAVVPTPTLTTSATSAPATTPTPAAVQPTATLPPVASTSPSPPAAATATPTPAQTEPPDYRDDRSTPVAVLESLYNAINNRQYARAWTYWEESDARPSFEQFAAGYADTAHVDLTTGPVHTGAAAGNLYFDVPVILHATQTNGSQQIFAGCYTLHLAQPSLQTEPPYHPMAISHAELQQVQTDADATAIFDGGCQPGG